MAEVIIITGGTFSGKTSVVAEIAGRGYQVVPEAAMEVITELKRLHGLEQQAAWRRANPEEFQRLITLRQHAREQEARRSAPGLVFCDRGCLDGHAYCRLAGVTWPEDLKALVVGVHYTQVFICATLSTFDRRAESGRLDTREDSVQTSRYLAQLYAPRCTELHFVPELPVEARADLILRTIGEPARLD